MPPNILSTGRVTVFAELNKNGSFDFFTYITHSDELSGYVIEISPIEEPYGIGWQLLYGVSRDFLNDLAGRNLRYSGSLGDEGVLPAYLDLYPEGKHPYLSGQFTQSKKFPEVLRPVSVRSRQDWTRLIGE